MAAKKHLSCNDLLFINEYLANGRNGTQAYRKVHPKSSYDSACTTASGILRKPKVVEELAHRVTHEAGITRAWGEANVLYVCDKAKEVGDLELFLTATMHAMKLAGLIVDRHESKVISDDETTAMREYVMQAMRQPASLMNG